MSSNEEFFRERRATAVLKHGILRRYPVVFASKAGWQAPGRRVVFLDGYAGPGQYEDGDPGSPMVLVRSAEFVKGHRNVLGFFVESDQQYFQRLRRMLDNHGDSRFRALHGSLDQHLSQILSAARGAALFAYLDPFGTALGRERLVRDLLCRPGQPTEVLLHFSLSTVARIGGLVRKINREDRSANPTEALTIAHVDRFLGSDWWQAHFAAVAGEEDLPMATEVAVRVAAAFCRSIERQTGFRSASMPVRLRPDHAPKYLLVLFTRHPEGVWQFADALGKAGRDWQGAWRREEDAKVQLDEELTGRVGLFPVPDYQFDPEKYEHDHRETWVVGIKRNIVGLLTRVGPARLDAHTVEVYGDYLGMAWIRHVRAAVKELNAEGAIACDSRNEFQRRTAVLLRRPG